jgi:4-hydroxyphenylpyruvate dioxygenase
MAEKDHESGLGIIGWDPFEYIVEDLEEARRFYREKMGIDACARLDDHCAASRGEDALLMRAGSISFVCASSRDADSRAGRWLQRRPEGVSALSFRVRDLDRTRRTLEARGGTFCTPVVMAEDYAGRPLRFFEIATPLGEVRFRFTERHKEAMLPGFSPLGDAKESNRYGFQVIDHVTSNFLTIEPYVSWLKDVMGFEEYWRVQFHTSDMRGQEEGSGLSSIVMWDPESGIKLANNEPLSPNFESSQIFTFVDENGGPGVQHVAFHVPDILSAVESMRKQGIDFLDTPGSYYDLLPQRLEAKRVTNFSEDIRELRRLGILVDGESDKYLLQIFSVEGKLLRGNPQGGPFFYEVIQRRGARGFGEGNFRALFEAIEREQEVRGAKAKAANPWSGA